MDDTGIDGGDVDDKDGGCSTTGTGTNPGLLAGLLGLVGLIARRRRA
ncbi:MYXO-CTERM sorting domain-containing protein [Myxococcota bacterium]|nr:MYXO-CTERM sorting domain-containing protein [Myxococcota bacterium]